MDCVVNCTPMRMETWYGRSMRVPIQQQHRHLAIRINLVSNQVCFLSLSSGYHPHGPHSPLPIQLFHGMPFKYSTVRN